MKAAIYDVDFSTMHQVGFDLSVEHPHKFLLNYNKVLHLPKEVTQVAWNFVNDRSVRSECAEDALLSPCINLTLQPSKSRHLPAVSTGGCGMCVYLHGHENDAGTAAA